MAAVWVKTRAELIIMDDEAVKRYAAALDMKVKVGMDKKAIISAITSKYPSHKDVLRPVLSSRVPVPVLKAIFRKYDRDGGGLLDTDEWKRLFKDMHVISGAETLLLAKLADKIGDALIDIDEFLRFVYNYTDVALDPHMKKAIDVMVKCWDELDTTGSGRINKEELRKYVWRPDVGEFLDFALGRCEPAADGTITLEDFWNSCIRVMGLRRDD